MKSRNGELCELPACGDVITESNGLIDDGKPNEEIPGGWGD